MARLGRGAKSTVKKARTAKRKVLSTKQVNAVKTIAKKVAQKEEETKFFNYSNGVTYPSITTPVSWNIFYHSVAQGNTNNTFEGDKINWRGIKVKWMLTNYGGAVRGYIDTPFTVTFMLVATKVYKSTTSLTLADIRDDNNSRPETYFVNNDTKILYKHEIKMNQVKAGDKRHITGNFFAKKNQMITFKDFDAGTHQLQGEWQYYLMAYAWDDNIGTYPADSCGQLIFSYKNYFKDS